VLFTEGKVEVQDEGSQILAHLVAAKRGMMVADFCAGAGGKTLAIGALMRNTGRLYAFDVSEKRLHSLGQRLKRSGLSNLNAQSISSENDPKLKRLNAKFDRVLVDAPCTGLGTLRRNPDLKWRQTPQDLLELTEKQARILARAAKFTKPGGRLIYSTCSLLSDENEQIAEGFLAIHPDFKLLNASEILSQQQINLDTGKYLKLLPHIHHTDGFFAAVFEKIDPSAAPVKQSKAIAEVDAEVKVEGSEKSKTKKTPVTKKASASKAEVSESKPIKAKAVAKPKSLAKVVKEKILKEVPAKAVKVKEPTVKATAVKKVSKPKVIKAIKE
jgi:16S rRNA (cytosine967-C5)-methyltransferase